MLCFLLYLMVSPLTKFGINSTSPSQLRNFPISSTYYQVQGPPDHLHRFIHICTSKKTTLNCLYMDIKWETQKEMNADWAPVVVAVILFILLSPGMLFQLPARRRVVEFGNMATSGIAILFHAILFFSILTILIVAIGIHIHFN